MSTATESNDACDEAVKEIVKLRGQRAAMLEALERTLANFKNLLGQKSVRDASETIAEAEAAIKLAKGESR